ncbi:MAG: glucose-1-phosphate cytidylyltransferase [Ignavibacteria bacterium]|nr:glucose-1-phosphate cytidylyltransferase [Ignavibacteria bacterium]
MKVVILCGGMGTRLREETEYKPKPMVEVGGKPILWHIMKLYSHYGYNDFILALGYKGGVIRDYFLNYKYYNTDCKIELGKESRITYYNKNNEDWNVSMIDTGDESMTGYRLKLCKKYIDTDNFMLTYGDAVSNVNIKELIEFHKKAGTTGTVTGVYPPSRFGDLEFEGNLVKNFKEKIVNLDNKYPINGGYFVFKKSFFDLIPDDVKCDLEKEPMNKLTKMNQLSFYRHTGYWQCMDTYRDYLILNKQWEENPLWKVWE